jgi:fido (protein-threonine AMPylation protein)
MMRTHPLTVEEREELIPSYIALRHELNEAEQTNIGEAQRWAESRKRDVLDRTFLNELHRRMFGAVWRWAGQYRKTARNIGVEAHRISTDVQQAIDDARYWVEHASCQSKTLCSVIPSFSETPAISSLKPRFFLRHPELVEGPPRPGRR